MTYPEGVRPIETMEKLAAFLENIGTVNPAALIVGAVSLAILIISPYIFKEDPRFPDRGYRWYSYGKIPAFKGFYHWKSVHYQQCTAIFPPAGSEL